MSQTSAYVQTSIANGVATVEFFHPASNSLPSEILMKLGDSIAALNGSSQAKVIVLRSGGEKAFCAGASFDELVAIEDAAGGLAFFSGFAHVINAIRKSDKLVIGRVQGKAVGGGVGLASAVDYCIAKSDASVKLSELAVGIGPFVVGPAVERKIGAGPFSQLSIDATEWRSAQWAYERGLYAELHDTIEALDAAVEKLASRLAKSSPEAQLELKKIFWQGTENWDTLLTERAGISGKLVLSDFTRAAIAAFKKK